MGIERFFNSIRTSATFSVIEEINSNKIFPDVDALLIDFNSIVHNVSSSVSGSLLKKAAIRAASLQEYKIESNLDLDECVIRAVILYIEDLKKQFPNCKHTAFFIDGVPNYGKMITQRSRRFISELIRQCRHVLVKAYEQYLNKEPNGSGIKFNQYTFDKETESLHFDKSKISPGTAFMDRLEEALVGHADYISGYTEEGEGEMKLIVYMRKHNKFENVMVYSPDADVILLTLLETHYVNQLSIYRTAGDSKIHVINVTDLGKKIYDHIGSSLPYIDVVKDIVILFNVLGNDFIPKLFSENNTAQVESIINAYKTYQEQLLIKGEKHTNLNWGLLEKICMECSKTIKDNPHNRPFIKPFVPSIDTNTNAIQYLSHVYDINNLQGRYRVSSWNTPEKGKATDDVLKSYCEGMLWITLYYIDHNSNKYRGWHYPHSTSPSLTELALYIGKHKEALYSTLEKSILSKGFVKNYFNPLTQLVYISHSDVRKIVNVNKLTSKQISMIGDYTAKYSLNWHSIIKYNKYKDKLNLTEIIDCAGARFLSQCESKFDKKIPMHLFLSMFGGGE